MMTGKPLISTQSCLALLKTRKGTIRAINTSDLTLATNSSTNTSTPRKFSISGAFNGTSIANLGLNGDLYTFYQDYLGQIRSLKASGQIYEAQDSPIILASGARNGTPLAAQYTFDTLNTILTVREPCRSDYGKDRADEVAVYKQAHLFYINSLDVLAEMVSNDNGSTWNAGSLDDFGFEASSSAVGLTALYVGDLSGSDTSVTNSAIRLYYGSKDDDQVHEVICSVGSENWSVGFTFPSSNGNAGMASSPMDAQGNASLYLLDEHNQIRLWSHLLSTIVSSGDNGNVTTTFAPVGSWYQGMVSYPLLSSPLTNFIVTDPVAVPAPHSVFTNSSLCYSGSHLFYQEPSNAIAAIHPPGQTDKTWSLYSSMGHQGIEPQPGSALAAAFENSEPNVFFQANGSDITQAWEDSVQWFAMGLPVG